MAARQLDALVVGAGVAGLYQLYRLRELGFSVKSLDAAPDVGGTWYWNAYPGARVDSPANVYQYWFSQDLLNDWTWSERFPAQPEIKRYLQHVAERFDLYRDIELNTRVESATWQDNTERWQVRTDQGELFVFQRKPQCAVRMNNYPVDAAIMQTWRAQYPVLQELVHHTFGGFEWEVPEAGWAPSLSAEERRSVLEDCWADGSLKMFVGTYPEVLAVPELNEEVTEFVRDKIRAQIDDPAVAAKLVPSDYGYGLHRVPLENGYFEAFNRDNVHLVDVKETPITGYSRDGLMVGDREYALDALVLATGFDAGTGSLARMNIRGRGGCSLFEL